MPIIERPYRRSYGRGHQPEVSGGSRRTPSPSRFPVIDGAALVGQGVETGRASGSCPRIAKRIGIATTKWSAVRLISDSRRRKQLPASPGRGHQPRDSEAVWGQPPIATSA